MEGKNHDICIFIASTPAELCALPPHCTHTQTKTNTSAHILCFLPGASQCRLSSPWLHAQCVKNMLFSFPNSLSREKLDFAARQPRHWSVSMPKIFPLQARELYACMSACRWGVCVLYSLFAQFRYLPYFSQKIASKWKVSAANELFLLLLLFSVSSIFQQSGQHDMHRHE